MPRKSKGTNSLATYKRLHRLEWIEVAQAIKQATGYEYHPRYLSNVGVGRVALSDQLVARIKQTYPDFVG